jgi:hypothetical protein
MDILHKHLPINESLRPYARQFCILMYRPACCSLLFPPRCGDARVLIELCFRSFIIEHENEELGCIAIKWCAELFRVFGRQVHAV